MKSALPCFHIKALVAAATKGEKNRPAFSHDRASEWGTARCPALGTGGENTLRGDLITSFFPLSRAGEKRGQTFSRASPRLGRPLRSSSVLEQRCRPCAGAHIPGKLASSRRAAEGALSPRRGCPVPRGCAGSRRSRGHSALPPALLPPASFRRPPAGTEPSGGRK